MKENELTHVRYVRQTNLANGEQGEVSERYIIPTSVPSDTVKAIDCTDLSLEVQKTLVNLRKEYDDYVKLHMSKMFSFDDWVMHTQDSDYMVETNDGVQIPVYPDYLQQIKWRSFKLSSLEEIKD